MLVVQQQQSTPPNSIGQGHERQPSLNGPGGGVNPYTMAANDGLTAGGGLRRRYANPAMDSGGMMMAQVGMTPYMYA